MAVKSDDTSTATAENMYEKLLEREADSIIGAVQNEGKILFMVSWKNTVDTEAYTLLDSEFVKDKYPQLINEYYIQKFQNNSLYSSGSVIDRNDNDKNDIEIEVATITIKTTNDDDENNGDNANADDEVNLNDVVCVNSDDDHHYNDYYNDHYNNSRYNNGRYNNGHYNNSRHNNGSFYDEEDVEEGDEENDFNVDDFLGSDFETSSDSQFESDPDNFDGINEE